MFTCRLAHERHRAKSRTSAHVGGASAAAAPPPTKHAVTNNEMTACSTNGLRVRWQFIPFDRVLWFLNMFITTPRKMSPLHLESRGHSAQYPKIEAQDG